MKILHLASFEGNIGDNANIGSVQRELSILLQNQVKFTNLEMREFYWKFRQFDESFASLANQHDLVMIGGGNYFELWVEDSFSGTSIDISFEILEQIKVPVVFYALGFDASMGYSENTLGKVRRYFDYLLAKDDRYLVSVRNDGSLGTIERLLGTEYAQRISKVPDGGFFVDPSPAEHGYVNFGRPTLAVNLAGDMLHQRHPGKDGLLSDTEFIDQFADYLHQLFNACGDSLSVILIPHIFKDLDVFTRLLYKLNDWLVRRNIYVAPYTHGMGSFGTIFDLYRRCDLILGTRFHANVCPIGMGVPTVGLTTYPQIRYLYEELGIPGRSVDVLRAGFTEILLGTTMESLEKRDEIAGNYRKISISLRHQLHSFLSHMIEWHGKNKG